MFNSKSKGSRHERNIAELLRGYGWEAKRTPLSGAIQGWKQDITCPDLPLFIEAKNVEGVGKNFLDWYKKVASECGTKTPVVVWTKNHEEIYAFILFTDLLSFIKKAQVAGWLENPQFKKPTKVKKVSLEETRNFQFSKAAQLRK